MRELFLVSFSGVRYGIWRDEIQSVRGMDALHRIPLSPPCIAGILMDEGRSLTLIDLAACLGYGRTAAQGTESGGILLMPEGGFVAGGEIVSRPISAGSIFPLPDFLKTPLFENCAVVDGIPVPVIAVGELYARVMQAGGQPPAVAPQKNPAPAQDAAPAGGIRLFSAGGERYAIPAAGIAASPLPAGAITPLPGLPRHVRGVAFHGWRLLPVIDLAQRICGQDAAPDAIMLVASMHGDACGLLVDRDEGSLPDGEVAIKPVPAIVRNSWLSHVAVHGGEIIPLVDLARALSADVPLGDVPPGGAKGQDGLPQGHSRRHAPASRFDEQFFRRDVAVLEFSLLGERHALPKQEVEDVIACQPFRTITDAPPVVIGLAVHGTEILPVLDLAMMFGRRSLVEPHWRMLLVSNGEFRALVIAESVFGERHLPLASHRAVPLKLPHHLMYGCYPDAEAVRLILNAEAIALHFEKALIQQFLPVLSPQMRMQSAAAEPVRDQPQTTPVIAPELPEMPNERQADQILPGQPETQQQAAEEIVEAVEVQQESVAAAAIASEAEPVDVEFVMASPPGTFMAAQETVSTADEWREWDSGVAHQQESALFADEVPERAPEGSTEEFSEESPKESPEVAPEVTMAAGPAASRMPPYRESASMEPVPERQQGYANLPDAGPLPQPLPDAGPSSEAPRVAATAGSGAPMHHQGMSGAGKRRIAYAAIPVLLLAAALYLRLTADKPETGRPAPASGSAGIGQGRTGPVKPEQEQAAAVPQPVQTGAAPAKSVAAKPPPVVSAPVQPEQAKVQAGPALAVGKPRVPAAAVMPAARAGKDVYVVKPGDTLWDISKHYTGDPYNYPRIGGDNSISDYDLIYPGQRIRLK